MVTASDKHVILEWTGPENALFEVLPVQRTNHGFTVKKLDKQCGLKERVYNIGAYYNDANTHRTWKHFGNPEFGTSVLTELEVHGHNDWAWGHNRLHDGSITLQYYIPTVAQVRLLDPSASFMLRSAYFLGWGL